MGDEDTRSNIASDGEADQLVAGSRDHRDQRPADRRWRSRYERYGYDGLSFFNGVRFSGMLDAYYGYDFNEPVSRTLDTRAFDVIHNGMTLN